MKTLFIIGAVCLVLAGCESKKELSREAALQVLKQEAQYPKVVDYDIFCSDPAHVQKVMQAGLENEGLLTVQPTQKLRDTGNPLIAFTGKAQPYLLTTPEKDKLMDIQKVKIADEDLLAVTGVKSGTDGKSAIVEYTTGYKNMTPFASLTRTDLKKQTTRTAYFSLYDDGWRMEKRK